MKILSILQARVVGIVPLEELNPHGALLGPESTKALVEKCGFMVFPQKIEDYLEPEKGLNYEIGLWDNLVIQALKIYPGGITVDTNSSTKDSEKILFEMLDWAKETLGVNYEQGMVTSKAYLSQLVIKCETSLNALNPKLAGIADKITKSVADSIGFKFPYEVNSVGFGFDTAHLRPNAGRFTIERRADTPFSENKYYASAPLPTHEHISLLEEFEAALKA